MLDIFYTSRFKRDYRKVKKRGKDLKKLESVITLIVQEKPLPEKLKDHTLIGNYAYRRECHIEPDWLLIYKLEEGKVTFERTGSHSDLF